MKKTLLRLLMLSSKFILYGTFVQCLFLGVLWAHNGSAQRNEKIESVRETVISLSLTQASIEEVFTAIEQKTNYQFFYDKQFIDPALRVDIHAKKKKVSEVLLALSREAKLKFKQVNQVINVSLIEQQDRHAEEAVEVILQTISVTGTVLSEEDGEGLPGVNVIVKGTSQGTVTDANGNYNIDVPSTESVLVFSSLGFLKEEVIVGDQTVINLSLVPDIQALDEVVVIGYGSVKKSDLTGSVSSVDAEELIDMPMASIDQGLVGRAAGVQVTQTSGMPGAIASIRVRGSNSIQGGNEPLYVIDGFPVYNGGGYGNTGSDVRYSGLATLNPADIESIEILKDASATSIYGARAANGVVLITTKKGKRGQDRITFDAYYGIQKVTKKIDMMNALEYAQLINEANANDGLVPIYDASQIAVLQANPVVTDWQEEVFRPALISNYQLTFSGGDEKMIYSLSANYFDQEGTIIGHDFKRYSARLNLERKVLDNFKLGTNLSLTRSIGNAKPTSVVRGALMYNPAQPIYEDEQEGIYTLVNSPGATLIGNPVATANEQIRETIVNRVLGTLYGEWEIVPGLRARSSFGVDLFDRKSDLFIPSFLFEAGATTQASINSGYTTEWLNENTLTYSKQINDNHALTLLGGVTIQQNNYEEVVASSENFVTDKLEENSLEGGALPEVSSGQTEWSLLSYLARVNYDFKGKYLLTLSGRVDGSSRFGPNNKYAFFPSGAIAWRLIEEDFISNMGLFSDLKIRTSYGITGNQEIGLYNSWATLGSGETTIGRTVVTTFYPDRIPNPGLKWEKTAQFDIGLDIGIFNNRLRLTTDYYDKKTTDLLYNLAVPLITGYDETLQNIGSVRNRGVELAIESDNVRTGNFNWTTSFNIAFNRNAVLNLGGDEFKDVGASGGFLGFIRRIEVGKPMGLFYGYVSDGLFRSQAELDAGPLGNDNRLGGRRYKDLSGPDGSALDGVINANDDRTYIGDANPDFFGGITNTISYKGFEANIFFQYSYGNDIFYDGSLEMTTVSGNHNVFKEVVDRWTPENPDAQYPAATRSLSGFFSDLYIQDGSYLKLRTLTLAYNFPKLNANHIGGLRVYITGQNLLTFTNYTGFDPEVSGNGVTTLEAGEDDNTYPQSRTFMVGVRLDIN